MSTNVQSVVLDLGNQLTADEFKLLMTIELTAMSKEGRFYPPWPQVGFLTGYTHNQCNQLLKGLIERRMVEFGSRPIELITLLDQPNAPCLLSSACGLRINPVGGKHDRRAENQ